MLRQTLDAKRIAKMKIEAILPPKGRDLRLDLLRGIANWAIFLNHIPNNAVNWITTRNYGFSDGADLFVFISGYTAALVYGRMMRDHGFLIGATRLARRVWQLYVAHVMLLVIYAAAVGYVALHFRYDNILHEFNVANLVHSPFEMLIEGLVLRFKPYAARQFGWNLADSPQGQWFFNPFCWQLLFCLGAWAALGGGMVLRPVINSQWLVYLGGAYLLFALIMTLAATFESLRELIPGWLYGTFSPNDKTNLAPYRVLHFIVLALLVTRFFPKDWRGLKWAAFDPLIKCGQQSLRVFCVGVFLSFLCYFLLTISSGTILVQVLISLTGIAILCGAAYYGDWSKRIDKAIRRPSQVSTEIARDGSSAATIAEAGGPDGT